MVLSTEQKRWVTLGFVAGLGLHLAFKSVYWLYQKYCGSHSKQSSNIVKVLFFPDSQVSCRNQFTQRHGCTSQRCRFSHDPEKSYAQLLRSIHTARRCIDLCVFTITCNELAEVIIDMSRLGVQVRVITDCGQVDAAGSQIGRFRSEGIQVRQNNSSFLMHHKFIVIDGRLLITGSFNWTRQAIMGNRENLIVTDLHELVSSYLSEFEQLWNLFDPKVLYSISDTAVSAS